MADSMKRPERVACSWGQGNRCAGWAAEIEQGTIAVENKKENIEIMKTKKGREKPTISRPSI
jgi:hypothetical protein